MGGRYLGDLHRHIGTELCTPHPFGQGNAENLVGSQAAPQGLEVRNRPHAKDCLPIFSSSLKSWHLQGVRSFGGFGKKPELRHLFAEVRSFGGFGKKPELRHLFAGSPEFWRVRFLFACIPLGFKGRGNEQALKFPIVINGSLIEIRASTYLLLTPL